MLRAQIYTILKKYKLSLLDYLSKLKHSHPEHCSLVDFEEALVFADVNLPPQALDYLL